MYFESVLLLLSLAVIVPYVCFSLVSSLVATADEDSTRKYSSKSRTGVTTTLLNKKATPVQDRRTTAIVEAPKTGAIVKQKD